MMPNRMYSGKDNSGIKQDKSSNAFRLTRWKMLAFILVASAITIFYIYNVMQIDSMLLEIRAFEKSYQNLRITKEMVNADMLKMESADRIIPLAETKLGLELPSKLPLILNDKDAKNE